ncbi:MAG: hypothetical protein L3J45_00455 [Flavobacteriaceae bacterium]|nr:hypothetical protein [Flavobacteriaceae bacterium]
MKRFLQKVLFYIIIIFVIVFIFDLFIFPNNNNQMTQKFRLLQDTNPTVLVLGNSHLFFGINPDSSSFNMINVADKGRKIETDYIILKENISHLSNLKYVIIPISHYTLYSFKIGVNEKRVYYNYYNLKDYKQSILENSLILNEPFRELIKGLIFKDKQISRLGWRANAKIYDNNINETKLRVTQMETQINNINNIKYNLEIIDKIINICEIHKVKLIFITPPYHPDFYIYSSKKSALFIEHTLDSISVAHNNIIKIEGKKLGIYNNKFYENSDHLNVNGAALFTKKIDSILKLN